MKHLQYFVVLASVVTLMVMSTPTSLFGQRVGEQVRVTMADDKVTGTIVQVNDQGFVLEPPDRNRLTIEYNDISTLERRIKSGSHWKFGGAVGIAAGGTAGAIFGWALGGFNLFGDPPSDSEKRNTAIAGFFVVGLPCGLLGSGIGSLVRKHKWEAIPVPSIGGRLHIEPMIEMAFLGGNMRTITGLRVRF